MDERWDIQLPLTTPLSLNARQHFRVRAQQTAELRRAVCLLARIHHIPKCQRIEVTVSYTPKDKRRRDAINLVPTLKACEDGLVDAKVVPDDTPEYVDSLMPKINPVVRSTAYGSVWLHVKRLA